MIHAVIMAGGKGTRLWPQSRENMPKQLWEFFHQKSLLQDTVERISPLIPPERVFVVTGENIYQQTCDQLAHVPTSNILLEPVGRNTAPCVGLAAIYINDPDACMLVLPSDHVIGERQEFIRLLKLAVDVASEGEHLVTFGIHPTAPETGFGYIQRGERYRDEVFAVRRFTEKPDSNTANAFLKSGEYSWNSGMFIWKVSTLLNAIKRFLPELHQGLMRIQSVIGTLDEQRVIAEVFSGLTPVSIDYGIMEKAESTFVIPADFAWNDVGSWAALPEVWDTNHEGNTLKGNVVALESRNNIAYADDGLISLVGVHDLVVVKVEERVLVCHRDYAQRVKEMVEELQRRGMTQYL